MSTETITKLKELFAKATPGPVVTIGNSELHQSLFDAFPELLRAVEERESLLVERTEARAERQVIITERDAARAQRDHIANMEELSKSAMTIGAANQLATLRAATQDHGAAIEAAAKACWIELKDDGHMPKQIIGRHMRALVAAITNSQQKGGEEPCAPAPTTTLPTTQTVHSTSVVQSNAAPTSEPEGAAMEIERLREQQMVETAILAERTDEANRATNTVEVLRSQLESSQAECERLRKDKERLDWKPSGFAFIKHDPLRTNGKNWTLHQGELRTGDYESFRAAIDDAMQPASAPSTPEKLS